jgi:hypothetical protein
VGAYALLIASLTLGLVTALGQITTYDIWAILAYGRYILARGLPTDDPFSFTAGGRPWVDHMWLTQVLFYAIYSGVGRIALMFFKVLVAISTLALVWGTARRRSGSPAAASIATAFAAVAVAPWWQLRPQIFTYLGLAAFLAALAAWRQGRRRALWALPVVMAFWVNLHAGFLLGLGIVAVWWAGLVIEWRRPGSPPVAFRDIGVATALTALATLVNPYGLAVFALPLQFTTSSFALAASVDWYPPNFLDPALLPVLAWILALFLTVAVMPARPGPLDLLLAITLLAMALRSGRQLPILVLATAPLLAAGTRAIAASLPARLARPGPQLGQLTHALLLVGGAALGVLRFRSPLDNPFLQELNEARYPVEVADFVRRYRPPAELFNTYLWAGYELWALPDYRVFIDNRMEVYPESVIRDYLAVVRGTPGWDDVLRRWGVRTIIAERGSPLEQLLGQSGRWAEVFAGREAAVFLQLGDPQTARVFSQLAAGDGGPAPR